MRCINHPEKEANYTCAKCGKPICNICLVSLKSGSYCRECLEERTTAPSTAQAQPAGSTGMGPQNSGTGSGSGVVRPNGRRKAEKSPGLALLFSIIPGFGQFYNEDYPKGFLILGTVIVSIIMIVVTGLTIAASRADILLDRFADLPPDAFDIAFERMFEDNTIRTLIPSPRHVASILFFSLLIPAAWIFGAIDAFINAKKTLEYNSEALYEAPYKTASMPNAPANAYYEKPKRRIDATGIIGIILVVVGSLVFLNMIAPQWLDFGRFIPPLLLIGIGAYLLRDTISQLMRKGNGAGKKGETEEWSVEELAGNEENRPEGDEKDETGSDS